MPGSAHKERVGSISKYAAAASYVVTLLTSKSNVA